MRGVRPMTYGSKPRLSAKKRASGRTSMTLRSARANHPLRTRTAKKRVRHKPKRDAVFVEYGERVAECGKKAYRKSPDHNDRDFCFIRFVPRRRITQGGDVRQYFRMPPNGISAYRRLTHSGRVTRRPRELLLARRRRKRRERGWRTPCSARGLCGGTPWASRCIPL